MQNWADVDHQPQEEKLSYECFLGMNTILKSDFCLFDLYVLIENTSK